MDSVDETLGRRIRYEIPTICPGYIRDQYDNDTVPIGMMPWHASVKMLGHPHPAIGPAHGPHPHLRCDPVRPRPSTIRCSTSCGR